MNIGKRLRAEIDARFGPLPTPERWVFIVGCYNSGTTLLHDMLAAHPAIGSMPFEGQFYTDQLPLPRDLGLPRLWALSPDLFRLTEDSIPDINVTRLKRQWGAHYNDPRRPILIEKTPTNAARTRWLQRNFTNSQFIAIIRNGYAVAEGIRRKAKHPIEVAARQWAVSNRIMLEDLAHVDRALVVMYESLVEAPEEEMRRMATFLDLDPADFRHGDKWKIHEQDETVRNMNQRSLDALSDEDRSAIRQEAGDVLDRFGY
jgi:hypothetical protein